MGQALSSHELFLRGLKESLKAWGFRVKKKDLKSFFTFITDLCSWFPQEGTIDIKSWKRVGSALQDYYQVFGPEKSLSLFLAIGILLMTFLKSTPMTLMSKT